jgi:ABC-type polysaccharide/polyol phosphate transport system ATPase subunit
MPAIELRGVHKAFRLPHEVHTTLTERILSGFRSTTYERFEALRGVDLAIEHGAFVGVIGGNGSGKSTMLKIMSGLLMPDAGEVHVDGSMSALLELGLGFSTELTVRENVELYAAVLGYPRKEATRRVEEAIQFAGIERFRDAKLKNLSTGMRARLGFATALQAESDILLLDEILAVGDADFQIKCLDVFEQFKRQQRTIILVTHDLGQVQNFCDRAVLLEHGQIAADGDPAAVIPRYLASVGQVQVAVGETPFSQRAEGAPIRCLRIWIEDEEGCPISRVRTGERIVVVALYEAVQDYEEPVVGFAVKTDDGSVVYSYNTHWQGSRTERVRAGQLIEMRAPLIAALRNGRFYLGFGVANTASTVMYDQIDRAANFVVHGSRVRHGIADLQGQVEFRIADDAAAQSAAVVSGRPGRGGRR